MTIELNDTIFLREPPLSSVPAFVRPIATAASTIAGIAWSQRPDRDIVRQVRQPDLPPAFGRLPGPQNTITGLGWYVPTDRQRPAVVAGEAPIAALPLAPVIVTWSFGVGDTVFLRDAPVDAPPALARAFTQAVGISGMAWYAPPDRNRPALTIALEAPPSLALTPATLPVVIAGMAWFALPGERWPVRVRFDQAPAAPLQQQSQAAVGISGMAWFIPADERRAGRLASDQAAAFGPAAVPAVGVSGMAWQAPQDDRLPARRGLGQETAMPPFMAAAVTWSFSAFDPLPLRRAIGEQRPGFVQPVAATPVPVFGMAWFVPFDQVRPRVRISVEAPASFGRAIAPPVGISGMAWLVQPSGWGAVRRVPVEQLQSFVGEVIAGTVVVYDSPRAVAVAAELRVASPAAQARQISLN